MTKASFGDNVEIRDVELTRQLGLAGVRGVVYGETRPSFSGVKVIGTSDDDYALNVFFEARKESFWFAPQLVGLINHGAGLELTLGGVDKKWVRRSDGGWDEQETPPRK